MKVYYTARFLRTFAKLESIIQTDVESAIDNFIHDTHNPQFRLHKLHGNMRQYHAFSANFSYRVIVKLEKGNAYFMDVGDHSVYE